MDNIAILLQVSILTAFIVLATTFYFTLNKMKWNNLLLNKQKQSGHVELRKVDYKPNYATMSLLILFMFVSVANPVGVANTMESVTNLDINLGMRNEDSTSPEDDIKALMNNLNPTNGGVFIVEVEGLDSVEEFNLMQIGANAVDYNVYSTTMLESYTVRTTSEDIDFSSYNMKMEAETVSYMYSMNDSTSELADISNQAMQSTGVYMVIGQYVNSEFYDDFQDERLRDGEFILSWQVILLEGYDVSKSVNEQSEEIRKIIEAYTKYITE